MTSFVNGPLLFFLNKESFWPHFFAADEKKGKKTFAFQVH